MDNWVGKVAVVTGASAGIGAAIVKSLAENGVIVVGLARRQDRLQTLSEQCRLMKGKVYGIKADITKEEDIVSAFQWIKSNYGGVDILVNNAGVSHRSFIKDGEISKWKSMFEVNVLSIGTCVRETLKSLKERGLDNGHIININSVSGHRLTPRLENMIYSATKFAARVLTEGLRLELANDRSKIRVTGISPGTVDTEIFQAGGWGNLVEDKVGEPILEPAAVANAVIYALSAPVDVQIADVIIRPTGETY